MTRDRHQWAEIKERALVCLLTAIQMQSWRNAVGVSTANFEYAFFFCSLHDKYGHATALQTQSHRLSQRLIYLFEILSVLNSSPQTHTLRTNGSVALSLLNGRLGFRRICNLRPCHIQHKVGYKQVLLVLILTFEILWLYLMHPNQCILRNKETNVNFCKIYFG
jgi:hypothetical protein